MDRSDLIRALGNAFTPPKKEDEEEAKSKVISASAGEKDVLRLLNKSEFSSEKNLHQNHPDARLVTSLIDELSLSGQSNIEIVGRELFLKFQEAVSNNDEDKITQIIETCKNCYFKLQSVNRNSPERALFYMATIDEIKKM